MPAKKSTRPRDLPQPEAPARITPDFTQTRHISPQAGAKKGWERLTVYEREYRKGSLCDSKEPSEAQRMDALVRRDAAKAFDEGWLICTASWPAGFDPNRIRVVGSPGSFVDHQRATKDFWERVRLAMSVNDWMICRRVCGEDVAVADAVKAIDPRYKNITSVRFRDALDGLIVGMDRARKRI